ncbi:MAG TPA: glycine zipper domain-containing protein [Pyrinomonadaceae bacterium]|nr:glycine zipper domain-containing protein [Pyrinomonadaceae bacterium]
MKKIYGLVMSIVLLAGAALPAAAQTTRRGAYATRAAQQRAYERQQQRAYERQRREYYNDRNDDRSFVTEHRDKLTVAGGTAAGAVVGALAGGKKGAVIGALVGAGASALYTYKLRDKTDDGWRR